MDFFEDLKTFDAGTPDPSEFIGSIPGPNYGMKFSDETRKLMSKSHTGKPKPYVSESNRKRTVTEETKAKMRKNHKGTLGMKLSSGKKTAESNTGRKWFNDGKVNKFTYKCPEGFTPGMKK